MRGGHRNTEKPNERGEVLAAGVDSSKLKCGWKQQTNVLTSVLELNARVLALARESGTVDLDPGYWGAYPVTVSDDPVRDVGPSLSD